jgi:dTDP-glucose 4,6-dehydratase
MIRATNVYGAPAVSRSSLRASALPRRLIELHGAGRGEVYIHIRDVSRGELAAMESGRPGEIYHFSPDAGISVRELVRRICGLAGVAFAAATRDVGERPGQDAAYVIDSSKARAAFGWAPRVGLDEAGRVRD